MARRKFCKIKLTLSQTDKVLDLCKRESKRINEDFIRQLQKMQQEMTELYRHKMLLDAEISAIIQEIQAAKDEKASAKKSTETDETTDDESTERA